MHQNRSKRQKCDVNYLELNIGKSILQPKSKSKSKAKKIDIVAALREPSETRLAAYQIQKERQHINPGDVIGTLIKMEIKSEVKIELDRINTRHKYKNTKFPTNVNYFHADGTPCKSAKRKANELLDLPPIKDPSRTTDTTGLAVETLSQTPVDTIFEDTVNDEVNITKDGLPIETGHQKDLNKIPPSDKMTESEIDQTTGLAVEMTTNNPPVQIIRPIEANKSNEDNKGLLAETTEQASGEKNKEDENTTNNVLSMTKQLNNKPYKRTSDNKGIKVSEAALGLVMLQDNNPTANPFLQKYDNSSLMPLVAACQTDYSKIYDAELADNDSDTGNDSDDTVILQQEIEDTIGETTNNHNTDITTPETPTKSRDDPGLPVEMTENNATLNTSFGLPVRKTTKSDTPDKSSITKELSKLSVTPVSPNRGKVVFKSYRLRRRVRNNDNKTGNRQKDMNTVGKPNSENDIQLPNIPSGNSTRPPLLDKYKIRKFQIDKVCYYTCLYCNKHFELVHYLNNHHRKNHPPVSCNICNKLYDTLNSLISHSYTHLSGNYQCDDCSESFHFKSELDSHKNKHSDRHFQCKKCDRSFI